MIKPGITISLLRREINFLSDLKDGSAKMGEIHFGKYKYREANFNFLPTIANKWISALWMRQLEQKIKKLDRFVVLTHEDATYWKELTNLMVISNPITIHNSEHTNGSQKRTIAVGRYTYQKGYDMLIKAWLEVYQKHPDWQLDIYGGGDKEKYQALVNELGLQHVINCNGPITNIVEKYQNSSIFVLSSRFEGLPLVLMEAMSVGLPPVAFACPCGPKDIITNGDNGMLCENGNIQELASKICQLIEDEHLRKNMGNQAAISIQRYTLDNIMSQWDQLFKEIDKNRSKEA